MREKDLQIQDQMIKFSIFLQENERKKKRAEERIGTEKRVTSQNNPHLAHWREKSRVSEEKRRASNTGAKS